MPGRLRAVRLLIRSHSWWALASSRKCCRSASTRWAARRPWANRKELRSVPRAVAARSSRLRSSSVARSSIRLVLAGRWPGGCRFLGLSPGYWLRAQAAYDTEVASAELAEEIERIKPLVAG